MVISIPMYSTTIITDPAPENGTEKTSDFNGELLLKRLNEIKDMDKSNMSRAEKRELRKEVKSIKKALTTNGKGIYLSVGAIIIIILLLILLV